MNEFTNYKSGKYLIKWAQETYEEMNRLYKKKEWNGTIRRAQEVVELSLKAVLKTLGIDYPKDHDVGKIFIEALKRKHIEANEKILAHIENISSKLANNRAPAFYFEKIYTKEQAKKARDDATTVLNFVTELFKVLKSK